MAVSPVLCVGETLIKENRNGRKIDAEWNKAIKIVEIFTDLGRNKTVCKM
jgi:hypothetical protein